MTAIVVISGPVASGKSTLAQGLLEFAPGTRFSTRSLIAAMASERGKSVTTREALQEYGDFLDQVEGGSWIAEALAREIVGVEDGSIAVVDSARRGEQIDALRRAFGQRVVHVHLTARADVLSARYEERDSPFGEMESYTDVARNATEAQVEELGRRADVVIDTQRCSPRDVAVRCAARLGLLPDHSRARADVLIGGQYGSEGKGNVAFHLAPEYDVLIRSGGPNAGHKVPVVPTYTHRLLPSGTLANEAALLVIAPGTTIDVDVLRTEIDACSISVDRLAIDPTAFVIEASDVTTEEKGKKLISSTASGAGAATGRKIVEARLHGASYRVAGDVLELQPFLRPTRSVIQEACSTQLSILVEGTQGSGLSLHHGDYPHVTSRDTNTGGLLAEVGIPTSMVRRVIMVVRTYPIRVGGESGPMGTEISWAEIAERSGLDEDDLRSHERGSVSNTPRRVAEFDWAGVRRSVEVNTPTDIALTFVDYIDARNRQAYRYEQLTEATREFVDEVELVTGARVSLLSTDFGHGRGLIDRRAWRGR